MSLDLLLISPGNRVKVYQGLGGDMSAIEPPTFMLLVAKYMTNLGYSVEIIDMPCSNLEEKDIGQIVNDLNPTLVGVFVYGYQPSSSTQNMYSANLICSSIKDHNPNIKIMISGTHPSALPERTLREEKVDFVCDRDGFETTHLLLEKLKNKIDDYSDVPSLWYRTNNPLMPIQSNAPSQLFDGEYLDKHIEIPLWEKVDLSKYRSHNWHSFDHIHERSPYASIYTTLGCPFKCQFCCINSPFGKPSYRLWSPDTIIKQIDVLVNQYGVKNIKFVDEMFVLHESHVMGICDRIIEKGYDLNIWAYARVDTVKDKFLEKLRKAGFRWLALGIESSSKHVRDGANKVYTNDDITNVVRKIQDHGIYVIGNYIFGLPDDTHETMSDTLALAKDLNCEFSNLYSAMCYPGSQLYKMALENGWELPSSWLGYSQHSYETFPLRTDVLTNKEVLAFRDKAFVEVFTDEKYQQMILSKFGQDSLNDIKSMLSFKLKRKLLGD